MRKYPGEVATRGYFLFMRVVDIKALKNELGECLRAVAAGETVLVTDRNRVVAELVPPASGRRVSPADALLADAMRKGWVTPPLAASGVPPRRPVAKFSELMRGLGGRSRGALIYSGTSVALAHILAENHAPPADCQGSPHEALNSSRCFPMEAIPQ
jgi:prevent-host-death family protein